MQKGLCLSICSSQQQAGGTQLAGTQGQRQAISQLYVALFGRAPDADGLDYWAGLRASGQTVTQIADAMFLTAPARVFYPAYSTNENIVLGFYNNVLNRAPDADGKAFWTAKLNAPGATPGSLIAEMIDVVANYAGVDQDGLLSAAHFNNRVEAAHFYAERAGGIEYAGDAIMFVNADPASVLAARSVQVYSAGSFDIPGFTNYVILELTGDMAIVNQAADVSLTQAGNAISSQDQHRISFAFSTDTAADVLNLKFNATYVEDNGELEDNGLVNGHWTSVMRLDAVRIETVNVVSSAHNIGPAYVPAPGIFAERVFNELILVDPQLKTLKVSGDQTLHFDADEDMTNLTTVDARTMAGPNFSDPNLIVSMAFTFDGSRIVGGANLSIFGPTNGGSVLIGSASNDTIVGGSKNDSIYAWGGFDKLTGGRGNDSFHFNGAGDSPPGTMDVITDFKPNTMGYKLGSGPLEIIAPWEPVDRNGDAIFLGVDLEPYGGIFEATMSVGTTSSLAAAKSYLKNAAQGGLADVAIALDSSTGRVYIDTNHDGTADMGIHLVGVASITAAAFSF